MEEEERKQYLVAIKEDPNALEVRLDLARYVERHDPLLARELWSTAFRVAMYRGRIYDAISLALRHFDGTTRDSLLRELGEYLFYKDPATRKGSSLAAISTLPYLFDPIWIPVMEVGVELSGVTKIAPSEIPSIPLFSSLEPDAFVVLARSIQFVPFEEGHILFAQGDHADEVYLLVEGTVQIQQRRPQQETLVLAEISGATLLGEHSLITRLPRRVSAVAVSQGLAWRFSGDTIRSLQQLYPQVAEKLRQDLQQRLCENLYKTSKLFAELEQREWLWQQFSWQNIAEGTEIFSYGSDSPGLYVILHGQAEVWMRMENEQEERVAILLEGDILGELSLLRNTPTTASVRMPEGGILLHLSTQQFAEMRTTAPYVEKHLEELLHIRQSLNEKHKSILSNVFFSKEMASEKLVEELLPYVREGFFTEIRQQPFFGPGLITVLIGLALFVLLDGFVLSRNPIFVYIYGGVLGFYLGTITLFAVWFLLHKPVSWSLVASSVGLTAILFIIHAPLTLLATLFRQPFVWNYRQSTNFWGAFFGHFVGSGLMEEMFKMIPVAVLIWIMYRHHRPKQPRAAIRLLTPPVWMMMGSASAVSFMVLETLLHYVPKVQGDAQLSVGMMLLIPRMITSICGHVAWTGIFAYFIGRACFLERGRVRVILFGWVAAAGLHGLWNACDVVSVPILGAMIAFASFGIFAAQLFQARRLAQHLYVQS